MAGAGAARTARAALLLCGDGDELPNGERVVSVMTWQELIHEHWRWTMVLLAIVVMVRSLAFAFFVGGRLK